MRIRETLMNQSILQGVLIWIAGIATALLMLATVLPLVRTGYWIVRLCDFPRLQLIMLLTVPLLAVIAHLAIARDFRIVHGTLLVAMAVIGSWQASHILPFTPLWKKELATGSDSDTIRLMIANVEYENDNYDEVGKIIAAGEADILLLIELDDGWHEGLGSLSEAYPHRREVVRGEGLGIALWSKLPIVESEVKHLVSERRATIFATLELPNGQTSRFVGVHPTPPGLSDSTDGGRRDSRVRDAELVLIAKQIADSPDAGWIVAGDFNDVAWSHTTRLFKRLSGLRDPRVGRGLWNSFHAEYPLVRVPIDQLFLTEGSTVKSLDRIYLPGSDHFAVVTDFNVAEVIPRSEATADDQSEASEIIDEGHDDASERNIGAEPDE